MTAEPAQTAEEPSPGTVKLWEGAQVEPLAVNTLYKVVVTVNVDNTLPRDQMQVHMHHQDTTGATAPASACQTFATQMVAFLKSPIAGDVRIYLEDFQPQLPHNPLARATFGTAGTFIASTQPREIALCLSYYAGQNTKRYRGRFYIPYSWIKSAYTGTVPAMGPRPVAGDMSTAMAFSTVVLANRLNGWEWRVASTVDKIGRRVTDYWVDDEWDIQRRRGFRGTTRQTAQVP